ncbi:URGT2 [Scenedesmus sp. PABB004]|nr:URGT2 [Scenedesmus sp. PABB004]
MGAPGRPPSRAADASAWLLNVGSAVTIVFVNKVLMDSRTGYAFTFACTLSAIHFLTAAACVAGAQAVGLASKASLPWKPTLWFSAVAVVSIASLNLSLLVNPVGLYQVAKLLVIPFVCCVEAGWMGRRFNVATLCCIATVIAGVAVVTVNDLGAGSTSVLGVGLAALSVVGSGMQQILCGSMQRTYGLASHQLLAATAPVQGAALLAFGPFVDLAVAGRWVLAYPITAPALGVLAASCAISVGVNVSQFMCLGRFSAATFQVLGHTKTILVLLISWAALGEAMPLRKALGMAVAVAGMVGYGYFVSAATTPPPPGAAGAAPPPGAKAGRPGAKVSKPGDGGGARPGDGDGDLEAGRDRGGAGGEAAPLLRNVSGGSQWAGDNVMVVEVARGPR